MSAPQSAWPKQRRLLGTRIPRQDGPKKAVGTARYSYDVNRPGMLHAVVLRSPHGHAKIVSIETQAAERLPGFKGIVTVSDVNGRPQTEVFYQGDEILAVAADTEEHARDCLRAIKVEFEVLDHLVQDSDALKTPTKGTVPNSPNGNVRNGGKRNQGNVDEAFAQADAVVEATYSVAVQTHVCLETHGMVAEWDGDNLTIWASTQAVPGTADDLANYYRGKKIPAKVRCVTHYMGGGYGSKFGADIQGRLCADLARKCKAPVKLFLDRAEEHLAAGNRPSATGKLKIGGTKDGTLTAFEADTYGTPGVGNAAGVNIAALPYIYKVANARLNTQIVRLNAGAARAMRAPGHPQNCYLTEAAVDDFCQKLGLDPLAVRRKNLPDGALRSTYEKQLDLLAGMCDWPKTWHPAGQGPRKGPWRHGIGLALQTWGGAGRGDNDVKVTIASNGSVLSECSTQDLGTGARTVIAIVVAEVLGLQVKDVVSEIGESNFGRSTGSGGSTTTPGIAPAALNAACAARDALLAKLAPKFGATPEEASVDAEKPGFLKFKDQSVPWAEACARLGMDKVQGTGNWSRGLSDNGVGGCQAAEVWVDQETGVVRCTKVWAVQDCGLIVNLLACEAQVAGGVIMGVNYALFEERLMDRATGRMVNPDMEFYKLGGIRDMPEIIVKMMDMPERGVIGIGEPPTIGTAAAVGNAVANAIGVRVPDAPFTPARVLQALASRKA